MKASIVSHGVSSDVKLPENTVMVNLRRKDGWLFGFDGILKEMKIRSVEIDSGINNDEIRLFAWIADDGDLAEQIERDYSGMKSIEVISDDFSLVVTI
ncbi:MAG: hypothetical protein IJR55_03310 [Clostridia bacterium]|nr:hypothetical protein [Clostridia bacterium]